MGLAPTPRKQLLATETLTREFTEDTCLEDEEEYLQENNYSSSDMKKTTPPTPKGRNHVIMNDTGGIGRMGSALTANHHSTLQNKEKENQDECHPALRNNERRM